jgi:Ni,Fe-hydrogenase I small subunit
VAVTAAAQPALEEVLLGAIPGLPKVHLHNKVLSPTLGGEEFLKPFRNAVDGTLGAPIVFVVEGSIPNENINGDGYWSSMGNDPATGEPLTLPWWIDRLAPKAFAVVGAGTCATYGGIRRSGESSSARRGGTIVTWLHMQEKFATPSTFARFSVSAVDGAVVSNPIAKKTTSRSGFDLAIRRASSGE